jgi:hypothetical protein
MDQGTQTSDSSPGQPPTDKFGSLYLALAYVDTTQKIMSSLSGAALTDALERLDDAYDEFPELELDRPRGELLAGLRSAAESMPDRAAIPVLMYCIAATSSCPLALASLVEKIIKSDYSPLLLAILRSLYSRKFCWRAVEAVVSVLRQQAEVGTILQVISEVLACTEFTKEEGASELGDVLKTLLSDRRQLGIESALLAQAVRSARRRLGGQSPEENKPGSRAAVLAMADRLRPALSSARLGPYLDLGWPSGRISFDEFLLQWPCEIELPVELDDTAFIEEAYRAILLREPDIVERSQYLRLLQDGVASKSWITEDLLASEELRFLEREVRVICGDQVITEPGSSEGQETPAVTWPRRSPVDE